MEYAAFLDAKTHLGGHYGFEPLFMPSTLFDFQQNLTAWALRKGRAAIWADTGLGKTAMLLTFAENIVRKTNKRVLILTPLAVSWQTVEEGEKFGIACQRSRDGQPSGPITVTNYEMLSHFDPTDYVGLICDEAGILKHFSGATQKAVTRFASKLPYRLLCTATPAPNDFIEMGTASEALGYLGYSDMLGRFFVMDDKKRFRMNDVKLARGAKTNNHYQKLAYRVSQQIGAYRMKGHAESHFWRYVASWARACRTPSDLGYDDAAFVLPPLTEQEHIIKPRTPANGMLFQLPAFGLQEERDERKRTLQERCEYAAQLVDHDQPAVVWAHYNNEGDLLERLIPDAEQVSGQTPDDRKEAIYHAFRHGDIRVLIIKPKIGAWGLNWQHCAHVVTFCTHSFESYYQSVRRCWRFGQQRPVTIDLIATEGEKYVRDNMVRKAKAADEMFAKLVHYMHEAQGIEREKETVEVEMPGWL